MNKKQKLEENKEKPNPKDYHWVNVDNQFIIYDINNLNYIWDTWQRLMDKLKKIYNEENDKTSGFWCNREMILRNAPNTVILVHRETQEIIAFYIVKYNNENREANLHILQTFPPKNGYGRMVIEHESKHDWLVIAQDPLAESIEFWEHMNVPIMGHINGVMADQWLRDFRTK